MNDYLTRENTAVMKGIAIILMLAHHLWGFPERIAGGELKYFFNIFGQSSISYIGVFGRICVSIFLFLSGYGLYRSSRKNGFDLIGRLKRLYCAYWKVFVIFIPLAFLLFSDQPLYCGSEWICNRYAAFSRQEAIGNFLGLISTYNAEWWFLLSYVIAVVSYPLIEKLADRFTGAAGIAGIILFSILVADIFPAIGNIEALGTLNNHFLYRTFFCQTSLIPCFMMGVLCARENLLERLRNKLAANRLLNPPTDLFFLAAVLFCRNNWSGEALDILYVPVLTVCCLDLLKHLKWIRILLRHLGKQSTNMWLIHSFFCYYFYPVVKIVVFPRYAVLSLLVLIVLSYGASFLLSLFWKQLGTGVNRAGAWIRSQTGKIQIGAAGARH